MIYSVSVRAGSGELLQNAQDYAIQVAEWHKSRIRGLAVWAPKDAEEFERHSLSMDRHAREKLDALAEKCRQAGVPMVRELDGQGIKDGLMAEAAKTDLMVLGLPVESQATSRDVFRPVLTPDDVSLLHELPCAVLVVHGPPQLIGEIGVKYQGGRAGKDALRMAAELAGPAVAKLLVAAIAPEIEQATFLAVEATEYLKAFDILGHRVESIEGDPESAGKFLAFAYRNQVDMIVLGDEPPNLLDRHFGDTLAEDVAVAAMIPTLIAR